MRIWIQKIYKWLRLISISKIKEKILLKKYQPQSTDHLIFLLEEAVRNEEYETAALIKKVLDKRNVQIEK